MRVLIMLLLQTLSTSRCSCAPFYCWNKLQVQRSNRKRALIYRKYGIRSVSDKYDWTLSKNSPIFAVFIIKQLHLTIHKKQRSSIGTGNTKNNWKIPIFEIKDKSSKGQEYCIVYGQRTRLMSWRCCMDFRIVFPTCSIFKSDRIQKMHEITAKWDMMILP